MAAELQEMASELQESLHSFVHAIWEMMLSDSKIFVYVNSGESNQNYERGCQRGFVIRNGQ